MGAALKGAFMVFWCSILGLLPLTGINADMHLPEAMFHGTWIVIHFQRRGE
jgi:hypothetical protein